MGRLAQLPVQVTEQWFQGARVDCFQNSKNASEIQQTSNSRIHAFAYQKQRREPGQHGCTLFN